jgi:2-dehydro-3-deoxyphosphooctonate aldolase (KDO 8-P synthase)
MLFIYLFLFVYNTHYFIFYRIINMVAFSDLQNNFFMMVGPNVIESEEHCLFMAKSIKQIMDKFNVIFIFKASFDKANRTSMSSFRGIGFECGLRILKRIREEVGIPIITDIHESWQAKPIAEVVDIIQIPAFLCRQTDLLKASAETGKIIHVKKGQFCSADVMHKCAEKIRQFGNNQIILCERGNMFGYQDLIVDARNLVWLQGNNLVSMDVTHCLQQPSQKMADGTIQAGGLREMIPYMGKLARCFDVNGIFMEVHDRPDESKCDAPTQYPLNEFENFLRKIIKLELKNGYDVIYTSSSVGSIYGTMGTIEADTSGNYGAFNSEPYRGKQILDMLLTESFETVLDIGAGGLQHTDVFLRNNKIVDICDYGTSVYYQHKTECTGIRNTYYGDFNQLEFKDQYDAIWCCHILEHQLNPNLFLKKVHCLLKDDGYLGIVVPPRKPFIVGGHVTLWNAGLLLYNLILAGFDCRYYCKIYQYDYNIGIIIKKKSIEHLPMLTMDKGDIELLSPYFPFDVQHNFNGDIMEFNWKKIEN